MRIAYYTTDEVNRYIVRQWGRRAGIRVECLAGGRLAAGGDGPVILDLDFLPTDGRVDWLGRLRAGQIAGPVLVHGHNIADADAAALARLGVHVCRGRLRRAALGGWLDAATVRSGQDS
jgi:hypothetical protein